MLLAVRRTPKRGPPFGWSKPYRGPRSRGGGSDLLAEDLTGEHLSIACSRSLKETPQSIQPPFFLLLHLFHLARSLGAAEGTEDVDFLLIADKAFPEFLRPQKSNVPAGALRTLGVHQVFLFLGHDCWFSLADDWLVRPGPIWPGRYSIQPNHWARATQGRSATKVMDHLTHFIHEVFKKQDNSLKYKRMSKSSEKQSVFAQAGKPAPLRLP